MRRLALKFLTYRILNHQKLQMKHLDQHQRYQISAYKQAGKSIRDIAFAIGVSPSTISREIKRNSTKGQYEPLKAQKTAEYRKTRSHIHYKYTIDTWKKVTSLLYDDLSPEQVSGRLKKLELSSPSVERIYTYIWEQKGNGYEIHTHLRQKCKKHRSRNSKYDRRGQLVNRIGIEFRPKEVDEKKRFGDFEIDTVIGSNHKGALLTLNDRASNLCIIRHLKGKNAEELAKETIKALKPFKGLLHTITSDNGKEFACHEKIAKALGIDFYFSRPYHSCDRGANENMNGLIRQYLPKGTSFENLTKREVQWIEDKLNHRPRKKLAYSTPYEYIYDKFNIVAFAT